MDPNQIISSNIQEYIYYFALGLTSGIILSVMPFIIARLINIIIKIFKEV